jgi:Arc/MetJ-type ribon-helix-helix transcriptional regulator
MTIHLPKDLERFVQDAVRAGLYAREDDVIRDALIRLRQLMPKGAPTPGKSAKRATSAAQATADAEETAFDVASRAGLIGCIQSAPRSPTDLSTNPKHMEGFGRE